MGAIGSEKRLKEAAKKRKQALKSARKQAAAELEKLNRKNSASGHYIRSSNEQ